LSTMSATATPQKALCTPTTPLTTARATSDFVK
jgi:hypothetical protein